MLKLSSVLVIYFLLPNKCSTSNKVLGDRDQECNRCNVLTDSFNYWIDKTSRGKFDGGDAAWEEAKLKSYARSEVRLVEVQESLCSEVNNKQDLCYALAGEVEHLLENWWFQNDAHNADLYTWLCIETLQHCCPMKHFGENCFPCSTNSKNQICSGHGKCHGEGTRKGNGSCICQNGFAGKNCDGCAEFFYKDDESCEPCHKSCNSCFGPGPDSCHSCKSGWLEDHGACVDHDECTDNSICNLKEYCLNKEGYYLCKKCHSSCKSCVGPGEKNCTSCDENYKMWSGICLDENLRGEFLMRSFKRLALYSGLFIILLIILRTSKQLASFMVLILAFYIYISETTSTMNIVDVMYHNFYS